MEKITTAGIDLAKRVFALHGVAGAGRVGLRKTVRREQLMESVAALPPCLIGMEACSGAHEWARRFQELGHTVRLMAPVFVAPYRKSGKNDGNDAEAICEAVSRPNMRFVPVKSAEQQAILALHRVRQGWIGERTATINRIRALLTEFGVVLPNRPQHVRRGAMAAAEGLPALARRALEDLRSHLGTLDERIGAYDRELQAQAREPAKPHNGSCRSAASGRSRRWRSWPPWATRATSKAAGSSPRGWVSLRASIPPAASNVSDTSAGAGMRTYVACWCRAHARCCTPRCVITTACRAGCARFGRGAAITRPWWRSPPRTRASPGRCSPRIRRCKPSDREYFHPPKTANVDDTQVRPAPGHSDELGGGNTMPTNAWEPGARLSSGPEHSCAHQQAGYSHAVLPVPILVAVSGKSL